MINKFFILSLCFIAWALYVSKDAENAQYKAPPTVSQAGKVYDYETHQYIPQARYDSIQAHKQYPKWLKMTGSETRQQLKKLDEQTLRDIIKDEVEDEKDCY